MNFSINDAGVRSVWIEMDTSGWLGVLIDIMCQEGIIHDHGDNRVF